jgi:hypothetical protein
MIDQPSLAILIDCWDSPNDILPQNIISFLDSADSIQTVVLASYNCKQLENKHWFEKYVEIFATNQPSKKIKDLYDVHWEYNKRPSFPERKTHPLILNYVNENKIQINMTRLWELEYYLSICPKIKNIYVLGKSWEECIKNRPLGYKNLIEFPNINILTNTNCVRTLDRKNPDLSNDPDWEQVTEEIWVMIKKEIVNV